VAEMMKEVPKVIESYVRANVNTALLAGAIAENNTYLERIDAGIKALGGEKALDAVLDPARGSQ